MALWYTVAVVIVVRFIVVKIIRQFIAARNVPNVCTPVLYDFANDFTAGPAER